MTPLSTLKKFMAPLSTPNLNSSLSRDITWDRPVFRPPELPNPRIMLDPLPFTVHRLSTPMRRTAKS